MTPARLISLCAARGISANSIPGGGRPKYTLEDAAIAIGGLPVECREACYAAFAHRWAGDEHQRPVLYAKLFAEVVTGYAYFDAHHKKVMQKQPMIVRERWPSRIREQRYIVRLIRMAILEERFPHLIKQHELWPLIMIDDGFRDMDAELWTRRMSRKYEAIRYVIESWCATMHYHMDARINPRDDDQTIACT